MSVISSWQTWLVVPLLGLSLSAGPSCGKDSSPAAPTPSMPSASSPAAPVQAPAGWRLVWQDEFDGAALGPSWTAETGGGGWGNNELQYYRAENARVAGGFLVIEARQERYQSRDYTSARIKTQGRASWRFGRIEARARVPRGQGIWPAFWSMGDDLPSAGWPNAGEIDIVEVIGREPQRVYGTVHGPGYSGAGGIGGWYDVPGGEVADAFHVFAIEWETAAIRWYVDDVLFKTVTPADVPGRWVFDHPFFVILNVAVGGHWPGSPDATTVFPQSMHVDYVRVYEKAPQMRGRVPSCPGDAEVAVNPGESSLAPIPAATQPVSAGRHLQFCTTNA